MALHIRPFDYSDHDYEAAVAVSNAVWPAHHDTVETWKFFDQQRQPEHLFVRVVAEDDGRIVALGDIGDSYWFYEPGKYALGISVHPQHRQRGIGTAIYDYLMGVIQDRPVHKLTSWTRENQAGGICFLEQRGFQ